MVVSASIQALLAGEQVAGSRLNRRLLDELLAEGHAVGYITWFQKIV